VIYLSMPNTFVMVLANYFCNGFVTFIFVCEFCPGEILWGRGDIKKKLDHVGSVQVLFLNIILKH
jgi:hypothetical protein